MHARATRYQINIGTTLPPSSLAAEPHPNSFTVAIIVFAVRYLQLLLSTQQTLQRKLRHWSANTSSFKVVNSGVILVCQPPRSRNKV